MKKEKSIDKQLRNKINKYLNQPSGNLILCRKNEQRLTFFHDFDNNISNECLRQIEIFIKVIDNIFNNFIIFKIKRIASTNSVQLIIKAKNEEGRRIFQRILDSKLLKHK
jgi:hypothetical protein